MTKLQALVIAVLGTALVVGCLVEVVPSRGGSHRRSLQAHAQTTAPGQRTNGSEELPREVVLSLSESSQPEFSSEDERAARRLLPDIPIWVVPASDELCLVRVFYPLVRGSTLPPSISHQCSTPVEVEEGRLTMARSLSTSGRRAAPSEIVGLAPRGVGRVEIRVNSGKMVRAFMFEGGGFSAIAREPAQLVLASASGRTKRLPLMFFGSRASP
jgi:hypothetical protein